MVKLFVLFLDVETEGIFTFAMDPKWPAIELALRGLNGKTKTLVCLEGPPPMHMDIAGGDANRYIVSLSYDNDKHYILQIPGGSAELVEMKAGGAKSLYPTSMLVPLDMALAAAKAFAETGVAMPGLPWFGTEDIPQPNAESVQHPASS